MEEKKQVGSSSSSSFTSDLFGTKDSSGSSSSGIFGSIFAPSSKVVGRELLRPELGEKKHDSAGQVWNTKPGVPDITPRSSEGETRQYIMVVRTSILVLRIPRALGTLLLIKMGEKMIPAVLQGEIGGKGLSIIKTSPPMACEFPIYSYR
ncbi:hypothetical protein F0562_016654 [Nyssa sinensis]|uniref:Uncharacterized protein n=1 Tax=Nyssa sinensis TaxID=561372 RepID=A0A5J4ZGA0_9ASTE|nr:hypothetical protein F0562_016654 [Nyssa sinensis]